MSEKIQNFQGDSEKIRSVLENNLTDDQKEQSDERERTYMAGRRKGNEETSNKIEEAAKRIATDLNHERSLENENVNLLDIIVKYGLSKNAENALLTRDVNYNQKDGLFYPQKPIEEDVMIELIEKLPNISSFDVGSNEMLNLNIAKKFWQKFPNGSISPYGNFDGKGLIKEMIGIGALTVNDASRTYEIRRKGGRSLIDFDSKPEVLLNLLREYFESGE